VSTDRADNPHAIDIERLLEDLDAPEIDAPEIDVPEIVVPTGAAASEDVDADAAAPVLPPAAPAPIASDDIDDVFAQMRDEAVRLTGDAGEGELKRALVLREAGDVDGCMAALERAARSPATAFAAASLLGRLHKERGAMTAAIEWFERAAEAPAPTPIEYHAVLYELAVGLEAGGETARALAVYLELQADAGSFRDVEERARRLAAAQGEG
jgi:tetratricopeptide (TPR) repeat protein